MGSHEEDSPLFETKRAKGRVLYRLYVLSMLVGICLVWAYRVITMPRKNDMEGRWVWIGLLGAEVWFGLCWVLSQAHRWNPVYRFTYKDRLSQRYEKDLPKVDIFVCTADPTIEPPIMVINTVLSAMAYDYPPEKLAVYLSDDGGSDITFYALVEASHFATHWIPYCKKFNVRPRSPAAHFSSVSRLQGVEPTKDLLAIKELYEEMEERIENAAKIGRVPEEACYRCEAYSQWGSSYTSQRDHDTILQILIDGRDVNVKEADGCAIPSLIYLAREKRPQYHHNFKAGALNALIRVSSKISNGEILLNLDCDMYSNDSQTIRDALCFFMDEKQSHDIAFVQCCVLFDNVSKNDIYSNSLRVITNVEFHGFDGFGGPLYGGSGCFHRRDVLCGRKYTKTCAQPGKGYGNKVGKIEGSIQKLEEAKPLASCTCEQNTQWGKEMGLKYGCLAEDSITGLSIQCNDWKSVYFNPKRTPFVGIAPTSLSQTLVQHKRWSEGLLQILISKFSPAWYAHGKISLGLQMSYCVYCFWSPTCVATIYYSIVPSLCLLKGVPLFPQFSNPWLLPFGYVVLAKYIYSLVEILGAGGTILSWWNDQRMWLYKRTTSFLFALIDTVLNSIGLADSRFVITTKVVDEDVLRRYEKEIMEFGESSPMFIILSMLALINLFCFVGMAAKVLMAETIGRLFETMFLQFILCGVLVIINWPLYEGLFLRKDNGRMPPSIAMKSSILALLACVVVFLC